MSGKDPPIPHKRKREPPSLRLQPAKRTRFSPAHLEHFFAKHQAFLDSVNQDAFCAALDKKLTALTLDEAGRVPLHFMDAVTLSQRAYLFDSAASSYRTEPSSFASTAGSRISVSPGVFSPAESSVSSVSSAPSSAASRCPEALRCAEKIRSLPMRILSIPQSPTSLDLEKIFGPDDEITRVVKTKHEVPPDADPGVDMRKDTMTKTAEMSTSHDLSSGSVISSKILCTEYG